MTKLILKPGREKSLLRRHPWIFTGALEHLEGQPATGETVEVRASDGRFLAWAAYNPSSQIVARVWSWRESMRIDSEFFRGTLAASIEMRQAVLPGARCVRLIHGESDGLPGIIVDRYGATIVVQLSSAGAQYWRDTIADLLVELTGIPNVFERSDADVLEVEGVPMRVGVLRGTPPPDPLIVEERELKLTLSVAHGHKTGFYLDQRDNRALLREISRGRDVLDCFCYTGGFALNAVAGGARSTTAVDASADALEVARHNVEINALAESSVQWIEGDVFQILRKLRDQARQFDLIVLDPPKFAPTAAMAERAARGYKDINLLALKLLRPGGLLLTFSCSGGVSRDLFQKIVAGAALDAGVDVQILRWLSAAPDHPVALAFPEGEYLKGLLCRVPGEHIR
jgi:23S rRNA (cytosine1962-C5)-methyltransferase